MGRETLIVATRELRAAVGVKHQWLSVPSLPAGHQHRLDDHVPILDARHRPANDLLWQ